MFAQDSIELLQTSGIQFKRHEEDGIDVLTFAEFLMTSGLVLIDNVKWLSFHRYACGSENNPYDGIIQTVSVFFQWLRFRLPSKASNKFNLAH